MFAISKMVTHDWSGPGGSLPGTTLSWRHVHCTNAIRFNMWEGQTVKNSTPMRS
jgi:hypothetical protein